MPQGKVVFRLALSVDFKIFLNCAFHDAAG